MREANVNLFDTFASRIIKTFTTTPIGCFDCSVFADFRRYCCRSGALGGNVGDCACVRLPI